MATAASGNAAVGTIKVVVGEVRVVGVDGIARQAHIGDKVFARETIETAANAVVQVQLENGRMLDLGRDSKIALDDDILAVGQAPTTMAPAAADIAAVQAQIAAGADPSKVAEATAAGGAPGAGGAGDGSGGTPVVIDQANSIGGVSSGFDSAPASITFPGPVQAPLLPNVNLTGIVSGPAVIADNQGVGTIVDITPTLSISDGAPVSVDEGSEGSITFTVTLSSPVDHEITVDYSTVNGLGPDGAVAEGGEGGDYFSNSGTLHFTAGATTAEITVVVRDDFQFENLEHFTVQLSNASPGVTIADNSGTGFIADNEEGGEGGFEFTAALTNFGNDVSIVNGTDDNDILQGGSDHDILTGGAGSDTFRFSGAPDSSSSDTITDFTIGNPASNNNADVLDLTDVLGNVPGLAAAVAADDAANVGFYIHFDISGSGPSTTATLQVDADGAGAGSAQNVATFAVPDGTTSATLLATLLNNNQIVV